MELKLLEKRSAFRRDKNGEIDLRGKQGRVRLESLLYWRTNIHRIHEWWFCGVMAAVFITTRIGIIAGYFFPGVISFLAAVILQQVAGARILHHSGFKGMGR
jgi:uncharacterized membrane protein YdcZ (DUF606 family)